MKFLTVACYLTVAPTAGVPTRAQQKSNCLPTATAPVIISLSTNGTEGTIATVALR